MARKENPQINIAYTSFQTEKVLSSQQLVTLMKCSIANMRLKLKKWNALSSYNLSGKYYCLPQTPSFDVTGIWRYKGIFFSKHGTLKETVIFLVTQSSAGLSGENIGLAVNLSPRSFLHHLRDIKGMQREKYNGRFIYFSDNNETYSKQVVQRESVNSNNFHPSDSDAIIILIQFIKNPNVSIAELSKKINMTGMQIEPNVIKCFLEFHNLQKKTPDIKP